MDCPAAEWIDQWLNEVPRGRALDLGPAEGACSLWLAEQGFQVEAVELDPAKARAIELSATGSVVTVHNQDIQAFDYAQDSYELILAMAILHFMLPSELWTVADRIVQALTPGGYLLAEVFTVDDPGYAACRALGLQEAEPNTFPQASRPGFLHYFAPGELLRVFSNLICLEYEESRVHDPSAQPAYRASASLVARKRA